MKSVLYVAALLMIGASIYGFVDYSKTSRHKEFKTMYDEPQVKEPAVPEEKTLVNVAPETISKKEQPELVTEKPVKKPVKKIKKKRTIDLESFSRAPLREKKEVVIIEANETKEKEQ
jgi:hypothetical protein